MTIWTRGWMVCALTFTMAAPVAWAQAPGAKPSAPADKPAAAAPAGAPGVVMADLSVITATVEAIDTANRTVTLKGPGGRSVTLKVGPNAKNFDQVKVGDKVKFRFLTR